MLIEAVRERSIIYSHIRMNTRNEYAKIYFKKILAYIYKQSCRMHAHTHTDEPPELIEAVRE